VRPAAVGGGLLGTRFAAKHFERHKFGCQVVLGRSRRVCVDACEAAPVQILLRLLEARVSC
jgi:hypothetical protein